MKSKSRNVGMGQKGMAVKVAKFTPTYVCRSVTPDQRSEEARDGTAEQRLGTAVPAHQKTHITDAAVREQRAGSKEFNFGPNSRGSAHPAGEEPLQKHLHACTVASHVVNRARDACYPQSLT